MKIAVLIWLCGIGQIYLGWEIAKWTLLPEQDRQIFFYGALISGVACIVGAPIYAAMQKGYDVAVGILLGLLSPLGLAIVHFLPDKKR
jgi:hypothetical protein